jgi:hypothetical protein
MEPTNVPDVFFCSVRSLSCATIITAFMLI